jgi:uncharacterized membrane protein
MSAASPTQAMVRARRRRIATGFMSDSSTRSILGVVTRWASGPPDPYAPPGGEPSPTRWLRQRWPFLVGLGGGLAVGAGAAVLAARRFMSEMGFSYGYGPGFGFGTFFYGPLQVAGAVMLAALGVATVAYIAAGFRLRHRDDALRILRSRYARGEIGLEEYHSMSEHLRRG